MRKAGETSGATFGLENQLCRRADALRGSMDASDHKHIVLGLVFLKQHLRRFSGTVLPSCAGFQLLPSGAPSVASFPGRPGRGSGFGRNLAELVLECVLSGALPVRGAADSSVGWGRWRPCGDRGADLKSAGETPVGSTPTPPIAVSIRRAFAPAAPGGATPDSIDLEEISHWPARPVLTPLTTMSS